MSLLAAIDASPGPFIAVMALGFLVGIAGHVYRSNAAIATGIGMIFLGTLILPLIVYLSDE